MLLERRVEHRNDDSRQRLTHFDTHFAPQGEHHRRNLLGQRHLLFQIGIDQRGIARREIAQVNRRVAVTTADGIQVRKYPIRNERRERSGQLRYGLEAGVQRLIGRQLVARQSAAPEPFAVQPHVPVRQVLADELLNRAGGGSRIVGLERIGHRAHERMKQRDDPTVDLGTLRHRHFGLRPGEGVDVGIKREKAVRIVKRAEELAAHFVHALDVELKIVPRLGIRDHVPAHGVRAVLLNHLERIDGVAQPLAHLVAVLVEHQSVRDDMPESDAVEQHRGQRMQREEPAPRLIDALGHEIGRVNPTELLSVDFERIMRLRVGHGSRVEPHVDQVRLAHHALAPTRHEHDLIDIRTVQVEFSVIFLAEIALGEILQRILGHEAGLDRTVDLGFQLGDRPDALQLAVILRSPDRQRSSPVARA